MVYVMSDIHGEYDRYLKMLDKIRLSPEDTLYVLGDVVDRGPHPVQVLRDMAARENVFPILGNHDAMAASLLERLMVEITEENYQTHMDEDLLARLTEWQMDGGASTLREFRQLAAHERADALDYLQDFPLYETVDVGERTYILVHAGLQNFEPGRKLRSYRPEELVLGRHDYSRQYFSDSSVYIVTGHTPTPSLTGRPQIYISKNNIAIDCGAAWPGGRLGCLCLDTMEEFYVD